MNLPDSNLNVSCKKCFAQSRKLVWSVVAGHILQWKHMKHDSSLIVDVKVELKVSSAYLVSMHVLPTSESPIRASLKRKSYFLAISQEKHPEIRIYAVKTQCKHVNEAGTVKVLCEMAKHPCIVHVRVSYMSVYVRARYTDHVVSTVLVRWLACCWRMGRNTGGGSLERRGAPQEKSVRGCN